MTPWRTGWIAIWLWGWALAAQAAIFQTQLDNGMTILVKADHRAPVVAHMVWYRVGANYELNGITGISHVLEHMMFKGTEKLAPGEFSRRVARLGGQENAFTSRDYTAYFQTVGKQHLAQVMALEAERMRHLKLAEDQFQKERNVVLEERRWRVEDNPEARLFELFRAQAFVNSPMRHPVIGWRTDIEALTLADLADWYKRWYAPNNAILVVVGDVQADEVVALAKQYYGAFKAETIRPPKPQKEQRQQGERRLTLKAAVEVPTVVMGFHVPSLLTAENEKEAWALELAAAVLAGDASSRLARQLVRGRKVAAMADAGYNATALWDPLFTLSARPAQGQSVETLEQALWAEVEKLKREPVSQAELARVLAQAEAQQVYSRDSVMGQAMVMGMLASVGLPPDLADRWAEKLRQITPADIQAVAQKYFTRENLTVGVLLPNGEKPHKVPRAMMGGHVR
ncbi:MAG TPA: insulinase family protein [Piscirickettsiaceae bacterium]|nr:insulinase family protein [Piscirickettsiaceae bacterium]